LKGHRVNSKSSALIEQFGFSLSDEFIADLQEEFLIELDKTNTLPFFSSAEQ
jgi:hypothetical protein